MKGKNQWHASTNGPDWMDVIEMMRSLELLHAVSIKCTLGVGVFLGPYVSYTLTALRQGKEASVLGQSAITLSAEWPCSEHKELTACVFAGLFKLDNVLTGQNVEGFTLSGS